ncbi:MAG: WYL domain-containing protein [Frankia sp.]|nr:WYL domain-containing protein [Frankia sp.]
MPAVRFSEEEAAAVAVALAALPEGRFAQAGRSALTKILTALGPAGQDRVADQASREWVQPRGLPRTAATPAIDQAMRAGVTVTFDYVDASGRPTHRRVEPQAFVFARGHWYLLAWCLDRGAPRWFRWDRIENATPTTDPAEPRDPFTTFGTPPPGVVLPLTSAEATAAQQSHRLPSGNPPSPRGGQAN